jgi:surface antigen
VAAAFCLATTPVLAEPPPWAPAHGWHKKHHRHKHEHEREREHAYSRSRYGDRDDDYYDDEDDNRYDDWDNGRIGNRVSSPRYRGYSGSRWNDDYGLEKGYCNRDALGAALGAAAGGALGVYLGDGQTVAALIGTALGAVLGSQIGESMDEKDRACFGHALELLPRQRSAQWRNPDTGLNYRLTPVRDFTRQGVPCREFSTRVTGNKRRKMQQIQRIACRKNRGIWDIVER